jgi:hypothetical protein
MLVAATETRFPQYRITLDPAAESRSDPWMYQIPGKYGVIYPVGSDRLAVEVDGHREVARRLRALRVKLVQDGDEEQTFTFHVSLFKQVAAVVRSFRKKTNRRSTEDGLRSLKCPSSETQEAAGALQTA